METIESFTKIWKKILIRDSEKIAGIGIGSGLSGTALFFLIDYRITGDIKSLKHFYLLLEELIKRLNNSNYNELLLADITEMTYLVSVSSRIIKDTYDVTELKKQLEELLYSLSKKPIQKKEFDPFTGAFYPGYYFSCRNSKESYLRPFFELLTSKTINKNGIYFDSRFQPGKICLSITHGMAFYIVLLCRREYPFLSQNVIHELLKGYVDFVLENQMDFEICGCFFPDYIGENIKTRLCLCYGDLGIIYSLFLAGIKLNDKKLQDKCKIMLSKTLDRKLSSETRINNSSLLYGDAGVYLFLRKLVNINKTLIEDKNAVGFWKNKLKSGLLDIDKEYFLSGEFVVKEGIRPLTFSEGITGSLICLKANNWNFLQQLTFPFYLQ